MSFLDGGGNLFLTGQGIAAQLHGSDSVFLADYLKAVYKSSEMDGSLGNINTGLFQDSIMIVIQGASGANNQTYPDQVEIINGGRAELAYSGHDYYGGVSYNQEYSLLFLPFGFEAICTGGDNWYNRNQVMNSVLNFFLYSCGDANGDRIVNVSDAVYLINYIFKNGEEPMSFETANVNCDGSVNVSDAVYLINYIFKGGDSPCSLCQ